MEEDPGTPVELDRLVRWVERRTRGCTPLDRVALATKVGLSLQQAGDDLVGHFVEEARSSGASWTQIGGHLGVSKQAAQQRHGSRRSRLFGGRKSRAAPPGRMFEHLSDEVREVLRLAQVEAMDLSHNYLGTEHLLLGMVLEPAGTGGNALRGVGLTAEAVRAEILETIGPGGTPPVGPVPFTPRSKRLLQRAVQDARAAGLPAAGTGRLLLALLGEREGVGPQILRDTVAGDALRSALAGALAAGNDR